MSGTLYLHVDGSLRVEDDTDQDTGRRRRGGWGQTEAHHPPVAGKQRIKPGLHSYDIFPNLQQGNR